MKIFIVMKVNNQLFKEKNTELEKQVVDAYTSKIFKFFQEELCRFNH